MGGSEGEEGEGGGDLGEREKKKKIKKSWRFQPTTSSYSVIKT